MATRSPVSNTFARYQNAEARHNESMMKNNKESCDYRLFENSVHE